MYASHLSGALLALDKHQEAGIAGLVIGALILLWGAFRVIRRTAGAMMFASLGVVIVVIGILLYLRKI